MQTQVTKKIDFSGKDLFIGLDVRVSASYFLFFKSIIHFKIT